MVEKLKLILRQTHWSLVVKTLVFGLAWLFLPYWLFFVLAIYFYFVPLFKPLPLLFPFFLTLILGYAIPQNFFMAVFLASIFYLTLGIKDLIFVERKDAYETLVLLLVFIMLFKFVNGFLGWADWYLPVFLLLVSMALYWLFSGFYKYSRPENARVDGVRDFLSLGLFAFFEFQVVLVTLLLPISYFYKISLVFLTAMLMSRLVLINLSGEVKGRQWLLYFSILFVFLVFIFTSSQWDL
ncbi:MAG: hypothetical protein G01um101420_171 [Parcubacteria group bacterium Gr01-1014_20]|nr:MAG: hypothetical protein G01um101420_171 [Parcubacteria group bacterium Gr01-1014_20]